MQQILLLKIYQKYWSQDVLVYAANFTAKIYQKYWFHVRVCIHEMYVSAQILLLKIYQKYWFQVDLCVYT